MILPVDLVKRYSGKGSHDLAEVARSVILSKGRLPRAVKQHFGVARSERADEPPPVFLIAGSGVDSEPDTRGTARRRSGHATNADLLRLMNCQYAGFRPVKRRTDGRIVVNGVVEYSIDGIDRSPP